MSSQAQVNVSTHLARNAREIPEETALYTPGARQSQRLTFRELDAHCARAATLLAQEGVEAGARTLIMLKPGPALIIAVYALMRLGAVPVIADPGLGLRKFLHSMQVSRPELLVGLPQACWLSRLFPRSLGSLRKRISFGDRFLARLSDPRIEAAEPASTKGSDLAAILFTSGSTGPPKGVCYEHGHFEAQLSLLPAYGLKRGDRDLPLLPVFALFNPALGIRTVIPGINPSRPARMKPDPVLDLIESEGITTSFGSPILWRLLSRRGIAQKRQLTSLRTVLMAGAPVPPVLVEAMRQLAPNAEVLTPYGATEALPLTRIDGREILTHRRAQESGHGTCVGRPLPGIEIRILETTDEAVDLLRPADLLPAGERGEILVRGPVVTAQYDGLEQATSLGKITREVDPEADVPRPTLWHRMGDIGYLDEDGRLWFCGRRAERVRNGASVLQTDCCEGVFNTHPEVARTALIGLGEKTQQVPALVVEPEQWPPDAKRLERELRELGASQPHTRNIDHFFFQQRLPTDVRHNAKIHRLSLAKEYAGRTL